MNTFLSILLLILCNVSYGEEGIKPRLNLVRNFDPCDIDKRITFNISVDNIIKEDSLFGFNLGLKYDTNKVQYINTLTANTIMNKFTHKYFSNDVVKQIIDVDGGVLTMNPLSGDSNLVAFEFNYIAEDFSGVKFEIVYLDMVEGYTKTIDLSNSVFEFFPKVRDLENRKIEINSSLNKIDIDSTLSKDFILNTSMYADNRLDSFDFKLTYDKNLISLELVENENYTIKKINENLLFDEYRVSSQDFNSTLNQFQLNLFQNIEINNTIISEIKVEIIDWDRSSCITRTGDEKIIEFKTFEKEIMNSINDIFEYQRNEIFEIYNLLGVKIYESKFDKNIPILDKGMYFINKNNKVRKIIIN